MPRAEGSASAAAGRSRTAADRTPAAAGRSRTAADRETVERFAAAWDEFVLAIRRAQARGQQRPGELTLAQYYLLLPLERGGPMPLCHLADAAGIAAPTATRLVDGLENTGLVQRERSRQDRRTVHVSLTAAGRRELARKHRQLRSRRRMLYEKLDSAEREQSERLLRHLAQLVGQL